MIDLGERTGSQTHVADVFGEGECWIEVYEVDMLRIGDGAMM